VQVRGADTAFITYPNGQTLQWSRVRQGGKVKAAEKGVAKRERAAPPQVAKRQAASAPQAPADAGKPSRAGKHPTVLLQRTREPKENAFTFLVPKGWRVEGGILNVNPLTTNGPGNSIAPKLDLTMKSDDRGSFSYRWLPNWNYADLSMAPSMQGLFRPGMSYQGMKVKPMPTPRDFLLEWFQASHPQATGMRVVSENKLHKRIETHNSRSQAVNQALARMGKAPIRYDAVGMVVEYTEGGLPFRECLVTTIVDSRSGAFQWSNEDAVAFRAPASDFEAWKPLFDLIGSSREWNPRWLASLNKAVNQRTKNVRETQAYINKVNNEILDNRRRTYSEINHENWLMISGQEEYKNPYTGKTELGTSAYSNRWVNDRGDVLYTDENSFDPNRQKENNVEWRRSSVRQR
jgi:hypothetical protein